VYRNNEELLQAMTRLRDDPALRNTLGEAGYRTYRSRWTEKIHLEGYLDLIEELHARKRGATAQRAS
jgi:hypothetical protein